MMDVTEITAKVILSLNNHPPILIVLTLPFQYYNDLHPRSLPRAHHPTRDLLKDSFLLLIFGPERAPRLNTWKEITQYTDR
jgi:hypothetical protein